MRCLSNLFDLSDLIVRMVYTHPERATSTLSSDLLRAVVNSLNRSDGSDAQTNPYFTGKF